MNRLNELPKRFNELKSLEMLDLTYNNLTEVSLGEHFFDDQTPLSKEHISKSILLDYTRGYRGSRLESYAWLLDIRGHRSNLRPPMFPMCNVIKTIRIIYLSDNDLKYIPMNIKNFHNLEILSVRDNDIESIPDSIESLSKIHELHLQVRMKNVTRTRFIYFRWLENNVIEIRKPA